MGDVRARRSKHARRMILVVDNYDSFTFNLVQLLGSLGADPVVRRHDDLTVADALAMNPARIVLSPGPGRPEDAGICVELIRAAAGRVPILGVCLGHQCLAEAFGGETVHATTPMHGKTSNITHRQTGLFVGISSPCRVARYHSLQVDANSLPAGFHVSATAEDGSIMGIADPARSLAGIQFHPESFLTPDGPRMVSNFLSMGAHGVELR